MLLLQYYSNCLYEVDEKLLHEDLPDPVVTTDSCQMIQADRNTSGNGKQSTEYWSCIKLKTVRLWSEGAYPTQQDCF